MDAYTMYLNTFRYVMNADPSTKSTWCDIFKYLPCLRRMLSCAVCGNLLRNPHGAANGVCLHHVCYKCLGGKMLLKPSCSWCKDHSHFKENKKLRILILCFKRLCAYISHSRLGSVIQASSLNGHDSEVENTQKALEDAEQSDDEYFLTPPPAEPSGILKQGLKQHKYSFSEYKPSTSGSGFDRKQNILPQQVNVSSVQKKKGGRQKGISNVTIKSPPKSNASIHVKRLKRRALSTSRRKNASKNLQFKNLTSAGKNKICQRKTVPAGELLVSQRPHRELSGKFSVGQLWRETFLEEKSPEPEIYPDSGIEVGNSSDQDHGSQSPKSVQHLAVKEDNSSVTTSTTEKLTYLLRDTRLHPVTESQGNLPDRTSSEDSVNKPKLTLKIPNNKRLQKLSSLSGSKRSFYKKKEEFVSSSLSKLTSNKMPQIRRKNANTRIKNPLKQRKDICRCARFKRPNQLTCFGQKCPCYRDKKPCVDCLCNGCKNPRRGSDSAPPLMHMTKAKENLCLSPDIDLSMPRLSPIPRI